MEDDVYTDRERRAYKSPPCQACGSPTRATWDEVTSNDDDQRKWVLGVPGCTNPACLGG